MMTGKNILFAGRTITIIMALSALIFISCVKPEEEPFERLLEDQVIDSKIFSSSVKYAVLLPEGYDSTTESYPVVYLLHGYGDDQTSWYKYGLIKYFSDLYADENVPMIFLMPQGFNSYYVNRSSGNLPYMDFFTKELVPEIDSLFRTKKEASQRAVMGYSMGGYGALILPEKNPDLFSISVSLSMSWRTDSQYMAEPQEVFDIQWGLIFGGLKATGADRLTTYYKEYSPFHFFDTDDITPYTGIRMLMDCGDDEESLTVTAVALHNLMLEKGITHEFRVRNGGHSWDYWKRSMPEALHFISCGFQGIDYPVEPESVEIEKMISASRYQIVDIEGTNLNPGIFLPEDYATSEKNYPVIYFFNDYEGVDRIEEAFSVLSFIHNSVLKGSLPASLIIEIPVVTALTEQDLSDVIEYVTASYMTLAGREGKVFLGNGRGAGELAKLAAGFTGEVNSCFLFDAESETALQLADSLFYYVDYTDKSSDYDVNYQLYLQLRNKDIEHEYRVRQGTPGLTSFINGINGSLSYLSKQLKSE
ncbi:MAG: hypothetical protein JXR52_08500 [Bacteroidales bacterium]|nr:hypothetical protein [Bacteroidales bacterium]MBN2698851.1 hypothetical protein [Bacteroidales bacterium]